MPDVPQKPVWRLRVDVHLDPLPDVERAHMRQVEIDAAWRLHRGAARPEYGKSDLQPAVRDRLAEAQNWRCCYCGVRMMGEGPHDPAAATFEHIVPRSRGGTNLRANLVVACRACNLARGNGRG